MGKKEDVSKMHAYLQKEAESTRGKVKRMLLEWGASLDQCGRKQEEIRKILRLKAECEGLAAEVKSRSMEKGFSLIEEAYDHNIAVLQEEIERKLTEKRKMVWWHCCLRRNRSCCFYGIKRDMDMITLL